MLKLVNFVVLTFLFLRGKQFFGPDNQQLKHQAQLSGLKV